MKFSNTYMNADELVAELRRISRYCTEITLNVEAKRTLIEYLRNKIDYIGTDRFDEYQFFRNQYNTMFGISLNFEFDDDDPNMFGTKFDPRSYNYYAR